MEAFPEAVYQDGDHTWLSLTTRPPHNQSLLSSEPCLFNATDLSSLGPFINVDTQRFKKKKKTLEALESLSGIFSKYSLKPSGLVSLPYGRACMLGKVP